MPETIVHHPIIAIKGDVIEFAVDKGYPSTTTIYYHDGERMSDKEMKKLQVDVMHSEYDGKEIDFECVSFKRLSITTEFIATWEVETSTMVGGASYFFVEEEGFVWHAEQKGLVV